MSTSSTTYNSSSSTTNTGTNSQQRLLFRLLPREPFAAVIPHAGDAYAASARREAYKLFEAWAARIQYESRSQKNKKILIAVQLIANNHTVVQGGLLDSREHDVVCDIDECQRGKWIGQYDCGYAEKIKQDIDNWIKTSSLLNRTIELSFLPTIFVSPSYVSSVRSKKRVAADAVFALVDFLHYTNAPEPNEYQVPPDLLSSPYRDSKTKFEEKFIDTLLLRSGGASSIPCAIKTLRDMLTSRQQQRQQQWFTCSPGVIIFFMETLEVLMRRLQPPPLEEEESGATNTSYSDSSKKRRISSGSRYFTGRVVEYYDSSACEVDDVQSADEEMQRAAALESIIDGGSGIFSVCPPTNAPYEKYVTAETCFTRARRRRISNNSSSSASGAIKFVSYCTIVYSYDRLDTTTATTVSDGATFNKFDIRYMFGLMYSVLIDELERVDMGRVSKYTPHVPCWSPWSVLNTPDSSAGVFVGTSFSGSSNNSGGVNCSYGRFEEPSTSLSFLNNVSSRGQKALAAIRDCIRDSRDRWQIPITLVTLPRVIMKIELMSPRSKWIMYDRYEKWFESFDITSGHQGTYLETTLSNAAAATFLPSVALEFYHKDKNGTFSSQERSAKKAYMEALVRKAGAPSGDEVYFKRAYVYTSDAIYYSSMSLL